MLAIGCSRNKDVWLEKYKSALVSTSISSSLEFERETSMMNTALVVAIVLISVCYVYGGSDGNDCSDVTDHLSFCGDKKNPKWCIWNKCHCPGREGCALICSNDPIKRCNGLTKGDLCGTHPDYPATCQKARLACVPEF